MQEQKEAIPYKHIFGVCGGLLLICGGILCLVAVHANRTTRALGGHDLTPLRPEGVLLLVVGVILCSLTALSIKHQKHLRAKKAGSYSNAS